MKNVPENELFSAYLDGELTAEEQAEVERLLAASPAARQLMDELRALSSTLQAMPTYKLQEDLTPHVLRAAERRMLAQKHGEPERPLEGTPPADVEPLPSPWKGIGRRLLTPRNLVWPATAVAVAVLLMLFEPGRDRPRGPRPEVAMSPADSEAGEPSGATMQPPREEEKEEVPGQPLKNVLKKALPKEESAAAPVLSAAPGEEMAQDNSAAPAPVAGKDAGSGLPRKGAGDSRADRAKRGPQPEEAAGEGGGYALADTKPGAGPMPSNLDQTMPFGADEPGQDDAADRAGTRPWQFPSGTTVVFCDVSSQAARSRAFDRLLSRQQIVLERPSREVGDTSGNLADKLAEKAAEEGGKGSPAGDKPGGKELNGRGGGRTRSHIVGKSRDDAEKYRAAKPGAGGPALDLDLVLVQATPAQIEATLDALSARPEDFVTVDVRPAHGRAEQQAWTQYTRGSFDEQAKRQLNEAVASGQKKRKGDAGSLADGYRSTPGKQKPPERRRSQQQRRGGDQFGRAVRLPVDGVELRAAGVPRSSAEPAPTGPAAELTKSPARPEKPPMTQPAVRPAAPKKAPASGASPGARDNRPAAAPAQPPTDRSPPAPAESPSEKPDAAPRGSFSMQGAGAAPQFPPRPKAAQKPTAPETPKQKAVEPKRSGERKKAEREESREKDEEAAPCQVLFVLRVVEPGDVAASARAKAARAMTLEKVRPPAAAEIDGARQAAPAGKR